ncbi:hypothetical protein BX600DRAFT_68675 [Xylariales sp. PMI_506]|nr:hypothetical protein BX600DRAFT_68675 [Xylariales sp. PMI_506]
MLKLGLLDTKPRICHTTPYVVQIFIGCWLYQVAKSSTIRNTNGCNLKSWVD